VLPGSSLSWPRRIAASAGIAERTPAAREASGEKLLRFGSQGPVVAQELHVGSGCFDLVTLGLEELKDPDAHGVVLELRVLHDPFAERQEHALVVVGTFGRCSKPRGDR